MTSSRALTTSSSRELERINSKDRGMPPGQASLTPEHEEDEWADKEVDGSGNRPPVQNIQAASNPFAPRPKPQAIQTTSNPFGATNSGGRPQPKNIAAASSPFGR